MKKRIPLRVNGLKESRARDIVDPQEDPKTELADGMNESQKDVGRARAGRFGSARPDASPLSSSSSMIPGISRKGNEGGETIVDP